MKRPDFRPYTGLIFGALSVPMIATAEPADRVELRSFVSEAALRFGVPEAWIWAVMHVESRGRRMASSPKGAMGLMQLMPSTWSRLRQNLSLGTDPFDPHDNIIGGTAYLRALYNQFGDAGVFAAYNAGPGRYEDYAYRGRKLPAETRAYVKSVHESLGLSSTQLTSLSTPLRRDPPPKDTVFVVPNSSNSNPAATGFSTHLTPFVTVTKPTDVPWH